MYTTEGRSNREGGEHPLSSPTLGPSLRDSVTLGVLDYRTEGSGFDIDGLCREVANTLRQGGVVQILHLC